MPVHAAGQRAPRVDPGSSVEMLRDIFELNREKPGNFRLFCPDETNSNRLGAVYEDRKQLPRFADPRRRMGSFPPTGRSWKCLASTIARVGSRDTCSRAGTVSFATYEAFALIVASMATQHAKWLEACQELPWRAPVPSLNLPSHVDLLAQQSQRVQPSGSGFHGHDHFQEGFGGARLPAAGRQLFSSQSPIIA